MVGRPPVLFAVIAQPVRPSGGSRNEERGGEKLQEQLGWRPLQVPGRFASSFLGLSLVVWGPRAGVRFFPFLAWKVTKS